MPHVFLLPQPQWKCPALTGSVDPISVRWGMTDDPPLFAVPLEAVSGTGSSGALRSTPEGKEPVIH